MHRCGVLLVGRNGALLEATGRSATFVKFFLSHVATIPARCVNRILPTTTNMERTRPADRSNLIRVSMLLFSILAIVSFALASLAR